MLDGTSRVYVSAEKLLGNPEAVPMLPGVYLIFIKDGWRLVPNADFEKAPRLGRESSPYDDLMYIGKSSISVRSRLISHFKNDSRLSSFRRSLGLLLQDDLNLHPKNVCAMGKFKFLDAEESALTNWMIERSHVSYLSCNSAEQIEEFLIRALQPPLNISFRKTNPLSKDLIRRARIFRRASARQDRTPVRINNRPGSASFALGVGEKIA
jgi:hypothetical protein